MSPFLNLLSQQAEEEKPKFTKEQAGFMSPQLAYRCGTCRHYLHDEKKCEIVSEMEGENPGAIYEGDGSKLWNAGPIRQMARERRFGRGPPVQS